MLLICFWVLVGYRYFVHAGMETVPLVFRSIDPDYLVNDYYLNIISDTLHHRFVFINFLTLLSNIIGNVEITMLAVYLFSYLILFLGLSSVGTRCAKHVLTNMTSIIVSVVLLYYIYPQYMPGAVSILSNETTSNLICRAIIIWAIVFASKAKYDYALVAVLLSSLFHPLEAILAFPVIATIGVSAQLKSCANPKYLIRKTLLWSLTITVVVLVLLQNSIALTTEDKEVLNNGFGMRLGHHWLPTIQWFKWIMLFTVSIVGTISLYYQKNIHQMIGCLVGLVLFLGHYVVVSFTGETLLISIEGVKFMIVPYVLWTLSFTQIGISYLTRLWMPGSEHPKARLRRIFIVASTLFTLSLAYSILPSHYVKLIEKTGKFIVRGNYRSPNDYATQEDKLVYLWIKENTDPREIILHPPEELVYIRSIAERSSVVQHNLIGMTIQSMREWVSRTNQLKNLCMKNENEITTLANKFNATWVVLPKKCGRHTLTEIRVPNQRWSIYRL